MDKHFLEFWGNFLINAAQGQQHLEDINRWLRLGFVNVEGLNQLFRKCYGLEKLDKDNPEYLEIWKKTQEDFRESFKDYLNLLAVVPREDYVALARRNEELKEKVAEQEETIKHLRMFLENKGLDYGLVTQEFQELIKKQSGQFQEMIKGLVDLFQKDRPLN